MNKITLPEHVKFISKLQNQYGLSLEECHKVLVENDLDLDKKFQLYYNSTFHTLVME